MSQSIKVTEDGKVEFTASQVKAIRRQQSLIRIAENQLGESFTAPVHSNGKTIAAQIDILLSQ